MIHPKAQYLLDQTYFDQRSPEWFAQRENMITASEVGSALGVNKYEKCEKYILHKTGIKKKFFNTKFTQFGIDNEDAVREWYEKEHNQKVHEVGLVPHPTLDFIGASPDGVCESGRLLEIKCPSSKKRIEKEVGKMIPPYYFTQMQLQLECCDMEECDFLEYVAPQFSLDGEAHYYLTVIKRDRKWFSDSMPELTRVWDLICKIRQDPQNVKLLKPPEVCITECDIVYNESDISSDGFDELPI